MQHAADQADTSLKHLDDLPNERAVNMKRARKSSTSSELNLTVSKVAAVDGTTSPVTGITCELPPHPLMTFVNATVYENHYVAEHSKRCAECHHNFPTAHFLELHITEEHDPIIAARRDRGEKTFECLVEGCEKVCRDWKKRRSHLVDKHGFPRNYDFFVIRTGIDGRRSLLRAGVDAQGHRKSSRERVASPDSPSPVSVSHAEQEGLVLAKLEETPHQVTTAPTDSMSNVTVDDLTSGISALRMVPRSVHFGRKKGRSGLLERDMKSFDQSCMWSHED